MNPPGLALYREKGSPAERVGGWVGGWMNGGEEGGLNGLLYAIGYWEGGWVGYLPVAPRALPCGWRQRLGVLEPLGVGLLGGRVPGYVVLPRACPLGLRGIHAFDQVDQQPVQAGR